MPQFTPTIKKVVNQSETPSNSTETGDLRKARNLVKEKRFDEASTELELFLQQNPTSVRANITAGKIKARQKKFDEALPYFHTVIKANPKNIQAYLRAGRIYYQQKKYDAAIRVFDAAIKQNSKQPLAYVGLAQTLLQQKKYVEAQQNFVKAVRLNPRSIAARRGLALTLKEQDKYPEAINYFQSVLKIQPDNTSAHLGLGRLQLLQGNYGEAVNAYQAAIKEKANISSSAYMSLAEALIGDGQLTSANEILTKVSEKSQSTARLQKLWGDLYKNQGLYQEATEAYQAAKLLSAEDIATMDEWQDLDLLKEMDDSEWKELAESYSAEAEYQVGKTRQLG